MNGFRCALSVIKLKNKIVYRRSQLIIIQKTVRMYLARKKYQPRITGIRQIRGLQDSVFQAEKIVNQLKKDRDSSIKQLQQLQSALNGSIHVIKHNERITDKDIKKSFVQLEQQAEDLMKALKSKVEQQKSAEEQERLRKIQEGCSNISFEKLIEKID